MATFAKASFSAASYATFRPNYPPKVFTTLLNYHSGPSSLLLDLGCGHGAIPRELSHAFTKVIGIDPSPSMITQARSSTEALNVSYQTGSAEDLDSITGADAVADAKVDMVTAGQAAHWFDYNKTWPILARKVRSGGTLAFVGYKDNILPEHPAASKILDHYCYGPTTMGPFWEQPGRNILRDKLAAVVPPASEWEDVRRITYEPGVNGKGSGEGEVLMSKRLKLGELEGYLRTFSCYVNWKEQAKKDGRKVDIVDEMMEKIVESEPSWKEKGAAWRDVEVENEWGSVILLARRR